MDLSREKHSKLGTALTLVVIAHVIVPDMPDRQRAVTFLSQASFENCAIILDINHHILMTVYDVKITIRYTTLINSSCGSFGFQFLSIIIIHSSFFIISITVSFSSSGPSEGLQEFFRLYWVMSGNYLYEGYIVFSPILETYS